MIVWLASYPRSGNTLARIILNSVFRLRSASVYGDPRDIGSDTALSDTVGHIEGALDEDAIAELRADSATHPIKTHEMPNETMSADDRVIYIMRDGRDAIVSYFHYLNKFGSGPPRSLEHVAAGAAPFGSWSHHVEAWRNAFFPRRLDLRYEDMVTDRTTVIRALAEFLALEPIGDDIPAFEDLSALNSQFFRKGGTGSWKAEITDEAETQFWLHNGRTMLNSGYSDQVPERLAPLLYDPSLLSDVDDALRYVHHLLRERDNEIKDRDVRLKERNVVIADRNRQVTELRAAIKAARAEVKPGAPEKELEPVEGLRRVDGEALRFPTPELFWKTAAVARMNVHCNRERAGLLLVYFNGRPASHGLLSANGRTVSFPIPSGELRELQVVYVNVPLHKGINRVSIRSRPFVKEKLDEESETPLYFVIAAIKPI